MGFKDPPCGGGMGTRQGFPAHAAPGSVLGRGDDYGHCLSVDRFWGCPAQQEQKWWEGRLLSLSTPDLTPPHQGSPVPKWPLPCLAMKTWKVWGLKDMQKTKFCKAIILLLKNNKRLKEKHTHTHTQRTAMVGLVFSASLCQIPPVLTHQTKVLVLPPRITDENRDTERLGILPQVTQLLSSRLRTGPLWSNLESRCCDDPEGAAETTGPMLSQARAHTHTCTWPSPLRLQKSEET